MSNSLSEKEIWTSEEFSEEWSGLDTGVRLLLGEISKRPTGCHICVLQAASCTPKQGIYGRLSEVNRVHKRHRGKVRWFSCDRKGLVYTMDTSIVELMKSQEDYEKCLFP